MDKNLHILAQPRIVAAVGLAGVGAALGIGLMLAKTLIVVGFLIALTSAGGVIWIYFQHFLSVYRALATRTKYQGVSIKELIVSLGMIVVLIPLSISVFVTVSRDEAVVNRGVLSFMSVAPLPIPGSDINIVNVTLGNTGNLTVLHPVTVVRGKLTDTAIPAEELKSLFKKFRAELRDRDKPGPYVNQIQPQRGNFL